MKKINQLTWADYGISFNRYTELKAFCLQYNEKKSKICRGISSVNYDGMPKSNYKDNALENQALKNVMYQADCDMILSAADRAAETAKVPEVSKYLIKSVTNDISYRLIEYDPEYGRIPVGKTEFYAIRRLFYHYLDESKNMDKTRLLL